MSTHPTPSPRKSAREIRKQLRSIYAGADGGMPNLTKLDRGGRSRFTKLLLKTVIILAGVSLLAWGGFLFFTKGLFPADETLAISIEGPSEVKAGQEVFYVIRYDHIGDVPVANLTAKLNLPNTFHIASVVPEPEGTLEWKIGALNKGSDGAITITGVFIDQVPSSQRIQALFTYKPANFNSDFQRIVNHTVEITDSVLAFSFTGPEKALAGDRVEYVINVQNTSTTPVYNVRVIPILPEHFTISQTEPALEDTLTYWSVDQLEPGELIAMTIEGVFTSSITGEQTLTAEAGFVHEDTLYVQTKQDLITDVLGGSLSFSLIVNGSTQSQTADLGESLRLSIDYSNNNTEVVQDMSLALSLYSDRGVIPIDWSKANLGDGTRIGNDIRWSDLKLEPNTSAVIDLNLPLLTTIDERHADQFSIETSLLLNSLGSVSTTRTLETTPIVITLNSDTRVNTHARYYTETGAVIGSGPLPPKVDNTTSYRVYWNVQNTLHTLENVKMSAILPQDVNWMDSTDTVIGTISFNAVTRQVTWTIPKLLAELGHASGWFELSITPDANDVGRFMKLTSPTSFEAKDTVTRDTITSSLNELTTELPEDAFAEDKGVVTE